jgi:hypothetical protein
LAKLIPTTLGSCSRRVNSQPEQTTTAKAVTDPKQTENSSGASQLIPTASLAKVLPFLVRLVVAYLVVTAAVQILAPVIEVLIARGARNLLGLISSPYYIKSIDFIEDGYAFTTWIGPLRGSFKVPSLLFTFGFPIGYVLALPGFFTARYWLRAATVVMLSYFVCTISVAILCDARLTASFLQFGITLQPEWRQEGSRFIKNYLWMFTVRLYPLLSVIVLALISGQFRSQHNAPTHPTVRIFNAAVVAIVLALLVATIGSNSAMNERIEAIERESILNRVDGLEELNADIGPGLIKLAEFLAKQNNARSSLNAYRLAIDNLEGEARRKAKNTHAIRLELFKAELLEESQGRRDRRKRDQ